MRIESVVDAVATIHTELKAQRCAASADRLAIYGELFGCAAVFVDQMLGGILTLRWHLRIQFERLKMDFGSDLVAEVRQRLFQCGQADRTPGAGDIGDKIDPEWGGFG